MACLKSVEVQQHVTAVLLNICKRSRVPTTPQGGPCSVWFGCGLGVGVGGSGFRFRRLLSSKVLQFHFCCFMEQRVRRSLKTLTSLNKEVRPFFLGDNSIWSFPSCSSLAITAFGGAEGYFNLAIIALRAILVHGPQILLSLWKME